MQLQDLIKECPELGEVLAEFENRISFLESSLPYPVSKEEPIREERAYQDLRPIKSEVNHILNKINTHINASKKRATDNKNKYNIYKDYNIRGVRHDCEADTADIPDTKGRTQTDKADTADKADRS